MQDRVNLSCVVDAIFNSTTLCPREKRKDTNKATCKDQTRQSAQQVTESNNHTLVSRTIEIIIHLQSPTLYFGVSYISSTNLVTGIELRDLARLNNATDHSVVQPKLKQAGH